MKIKAFKIENYRNITLAECGDVPNFVVICGGNGSGKSAILEALMTAKEAVSAYYSFAFDPRAISANADKATIAMTLEFSAEEQAFCLKEFGGTCPAVHQIIVELGRNSGAQAVAGSHHIVNQLLRHFRRTVDQPGFFDYINAHRQAPKQNLQNWDSSYLSDDRAKQTLGSNTDKFQQTKTYLAGLKVSDLQVLSAGLSAGKPVAQDSLKPIREQFDRFFDPMKFTDVLIHKSPFEFVVSTSKGDIDIDDLSSGEKEILNMFTRFDQLHPQGAVILFDEADAHLHPDLERRYLTALREMARNNQLILTTHSPEMMIAAGKDSLFTITKEASAASPNQFVAVSGTAEMHEALANLMGSRGLLSFNQRIVFIEGDDSSTDRELYEYFYPPSQHHVSFVPAGNSATVRKTAERVNLLLSSSTGFQQYFSIVDRDIPRAEDAPVAGGRLFRLPVYHVENLLIADDAPIFEAAKVMLGANSPFASVDDVRVTLEGLVLDPNHLKPYTKALLDAKIAAAAKRAYDSVFSKTKGEAVPTPDFAVVEAEATEHLEQALTAGTWRREAKGRDLLKAFCGKSGLKYEHFSNVLLNQIKTPPAELQAIMAEILKA